MSDSDENSKTSTSRVNANPNYSLIHKAENKPRTFLSASRSAHDLKNGFSHQKQRNDTKLRTSIVPPTNSNLQSRPQPLAKTAIVSCLCILLCFFFEKIAFYGLAGNLVLFLNKAPFFWVSYHAQSTLLFFFGVAFLMAPLGGWIADSYTGRFKTIVVALAVYTGCYTLLPFISVTDKDDGVDGEDWFESLPNLCGLTGNETSQPRGNPFEERCVWFIYPVLVIIAMADGFIKANLGPFGFDQLTGASSSTHLSFISWYFWCGNLGAFVGLGAIAYLQQQISFTLGYAVCAACLALGVVVFVFAFSFRAPTLGNLMSDFLTKASRLVTMETMSLNIAAIFGRLFYTVVPAPGSILSVIIKIIREARARKKQHNKFRNSRRNSGGTGISVISHSRGLNPPRRLRFLDFAKRQHGGTFQSSAVNDVRTLKIILAVFAALIPYWLVYYQMQTTFLVQGLHMRLTFTDGDEADVRNETITSTPVPSTLGNSTSKIESKIAAAWFTLFDALFVIILLPLFDRIIYPRLSRAGYPFTFTKRVVVGMLFSVSAMIVAGVVENYRLKAFWPHDDQPCLNASVTQYIGNAEYGVANMSVLWQIPQYALIGISEVFVCVSSLQFAVSVSPKSMKALITGIYYTSCGLGSLLGTLLLYIFSQSGVWFFKDNFGNISCRIPCSEDEPYVKSSCHLDYYFYFLGGLESAAIVVFIYVSYRFGLNTEHPLTHNTPSRENISHRSQ